MDNETPGKDNTSMSETAQPAAPMMPPASAEPMKSGDGYDKAGGYGKKGSLGKWIMIYVVIAAVVYVAGYYIYKHYTGGASSGSSLY